MQTVSETVCIKHQRLFSGENKKNISESRLAEIFTQLAKS